MNDWQLLVAYRDQGDENAFSELVKRNLPLVYAAALRQTRDPSAAEEITQSVFILLVEKAPVLKQKGSLPAWLYKAARFKAKSHRRSEIARRKREQKAQTPRPAENPADEVHWNDIMPLLDEAMDTLSEPDRTAVLLRFFQERPLREVGENLGMSEDAARKRVSRALKKLHLWFTKRNVLPSVTALASVIAANAARADHAQLTQNVLNATTAALSSSTQAASASASATTAAIGKIALAAAFIAGTALPIGLASYHTTDKNTHPSAAGSANSKNSLPEQSSDHQDSSLLAHWKRLRNQYGPPNGSMSELLEAAQNTTSNIRRQAFTDTALVEWINTNPFEALSETYTSFAPQILTRWLEIDPDAARNHITKNAADYPNLLHTHFEVIASLAPDTLPELASHQDTSAYFGTKDTVVRAFTTAARAQLAETRSFAEQMQGPKRAEAFAGVASAWAETDPQAAMAWIRELNNGPNKNHAIAGLLAGWAKRDPGAALNQLDLLSHSSDEDYRNQLPLRDEIFRSAAQVDFDATLAFLESKKGSRYSANRLQGVHEAVQKRLLEEGPETLANFRQRKNAKTLARVVADTLGNRFRASDSRSKVWAWLDNQPLDPFTKELATGLIRDYRYYNDTAALLSWLKTKPEFLEPDSHGNANHISFCAKALVRDCNDFARFEELQIDIPKVLQEKAAAAFWQNWSSGGGPIEPLLSRLNEFDPETQSQATKWIAKRKAEVDLAAAVSWANGLPLDKQRVPAFEMIAEEWAKVDSHACSNWITSLTRGRERDAAILALIRESARDDPASALEWADEFETDEKRTSAIEMVLRTWSRSDPYHALVSLDSLNLSRRQYNRIRKDIEADIP